MTGSVDSTRVRYPAALRPGDTIGVTAPSAGVQPELWPRFEFAVNWLRDKGFTVEVGECIRTPSHVSAPREARAAELMRMLLDPTIRAVVPPWGGETGMDLLDLLDLPALADPAVEPAWLVGYSDTSTVITPITLATGWASIHGLNLMDSPYDVAPGLVGWLDVATAGAGTTIRQTSPNRFRATGHDRWEDDPTITALTLPDTGTWRRLDSVDTGGDVTDQAVRVTGRLIGGCVETVGLLPCRFADVPRWAKQYAPEGTIVYLDVCDWGAFDICRTMHAMRLSGWFEQANAVLVSRTAAPDRENFTQHDAARDALAMLGIPIIADVECGHVKPNVPLVNGALATLTWAPGELGGIDQALV